MSFDEIYNKTEHFFGNQIKEYGATALGVGWNGPEAQFIRYEQLSKLLDTAEPGFSVLDYGCGYGYYFDYLKEKISTDKIYQYYGIDISKEMIQSALSLHPKQSCSFSVGREIKGEYDYIVSSGIFGMKQDIETDIWHEYVMDVIGKFNRHSKKGFAFNLLTKYSDAEKMRDDLYYADPLLLFDYCKKSFSRNVALLHDYELYDFTILVRK